MKKIFTKSLKKWFTLVEMMLVIAILGIFFAIVSQFDFSSRVNQEKATNFAHYIADIIRDARHDAIVGRMNESRTLISSRKIIFDNISSTLQVSAIDEKGNEFDIKIFSPNDGFWFWDDNFNIDKVFMSDKGFSNKIDNLEEDIFFEEVSKMNLILSENDVKKEVTVYETQMQWYDCPDETTSGNVTNDCFAIVRWNIIPYDYPRTFKIVVEYKGFKRYIYGDILSGAIYVLNSESK